MSVITNAYRESILAGGVPNLNSLSIALAVSFATLFLGFKYFKKLEKTFSDNV